MIIDDGKFEDFGAGAADCTTVEHGPINPARAPAFVFLFFIFLTDWEPPSANPRRIGRKFRALGGT